MGRDRFLKLLKDFDDNYFIEESRKKYYKDKAEENNQTLKQFFSSDSTSPLQWYSQIDYKKIENATRNNPTNPFQPFYNLDEWKLDLFFDILHKTNLFLEYFEKYEFDRLREYKKRERLIKKYNAVIEDQEAIKADDKQIQSLKDRAKSLKISPTITKRRIFENLLYYMCIILDDRKEKTFTLTEQIANITNKIIENYFDDTDSRTKFSKKTDINNFQRYVYEIETLKPIPLLHSKA